MLWLLYRRYRHSRSRSRSRSSRRYYSRSYSRSLSRSHSPTQSRSPSRTHSRSRSHSRSLSRSPRCSLWWHFSLMLVVKEVLFLSGTCICFIIKFLCCYLSKKKFLCCFSFSTKALVLQEKKQIEILRNPQVHIWSVGFHGMQLAASTVYVCLYIVLFYFWANYMLM